MALQMDSWADPDLHALLTTRSPVRATVLDQARETLRHLDVPELDQRALDLIGIMNGLFYDRLIGYGLRGTPVDAAAVLRAWLIGVTG
jgi:hypothetical protein